MLPRKFARIFVLLTGSSPGSVPKFVLQSRSGFERNSCFLRDLNQPSFPIPPLRTGDGEGKKLQSQTARSDIRRYIKRSRIRDPPLLGRFPFSGRSPRSGFFFAQKKPSQAWWQGTVGENERAVSVAATVSTLASRGGFGSTKPNCQWPKVEQRLMH